MKKLIKITSGVALMFALVLTFSSFNSNSVEPDNNSGVEIVKDGVRCYQSATCGDISCSIKQTLQYKGGDLHMRTTIYQLPPGHCDIPDKNARVERPWDGYWVIYTPSGKVIAKEVYN
ncbi:hypothetical protein MWU50_08405 [Flavobacteriaceae bacterium S0862]|nr:hypothetical protein [Flavobacteriaceae bacterium S0862]